MTRVPARQHLSHGRAVALMVLATLMWSIAGVVMRQLDSAPAFEVTFWRSAFNALTLVLALRWMRGPTLWRQITTAGWPLRGSGLCWAVMFTAFMVALTMTSVANVLITMAVAPLMTALFARLFMAQQLASRTWCAIGAAGIGIAWMFGQGASHGSPDDLIGTAIAFAVPLAAAINWTVLQHVRDGEHGERLDMLPSLLVGAVISSLITLPFAVPLQASAHDVALLAVLGVFQLALPCLLVVRLSQVLPAPEMALLGLLEVIFGVLWAWVGAGEAASHAALTGGALVIGALGVNEWLALRGRSPRANA
jgi:drug/metabolite transporter (DMT)-like permease